MFLNNGPFSSEFQNATASATAAHTLYGKIPEEHWSYPAWVSESKAASELSRMEREGVGYGGCVLGTPQGFEQYGPKKALLYNLHCSSC